MQLERLQSSCSLNWLACKHCLNVAGPAGDSVGAACCADVETAAHYDNWQRTGRDAQNRRQDLWPPHLRNARAIPGVEYIQVLAGLCMCWCSRSRFSCLIHTCLPCSRLDSLCSRMQGHALTSGLQSSLHTDKQG